VAVAAVTPTIGAPASTVFAFSATGSFDPDGRITSYTWSFGDGKTDAGEKVNHIFFVAGGYQVTLTVTDNDGASRSTSVCVVVGPAFASPVNVSNSPATIETLPAIAVDHGGKVHIAYQSFFLQAGAPDSVASEIAYVTNAGGSWSAPVKIPVGVAYYSRDPDIAVDRHGTAHVVFRRSTDQISVRTDDRLYYVNNEGGILGAPVPIVEGDCAEDRFQMPYAPMVAVDDADVVHVGFVGQKPCSATVQIFYLNRRGGVFSPPVPASGGLPFLTTFTMALDRNGWPHFAFFAIPESGTMYQTFYTKGVTDPLGSAQFSTPVNVSNQPRSMTDVYPALAIDGQGFAHIVYRDPFILPAGGTQLYHVTNRGGGFDTREGLMCGVTAPALSLDSEGHAHIVAKSAFNVGYGTNIGGAFSTATVVYLGNTPNLSNYSRRHFALGDDGTIHVAYSTAPPGGSDYEIYYVSGRFPSCPP